MPAMEAIVTRILSARRTRLIGSKPMFERYRAATQQDLSELEQRLGCPLPESLRAWLLQVGFGDINEELSLRSEWFDIIDRGQLKGHVIFAQDDLGNFYSLSPTDGRVHHICRSAPECAFMGRDFMDFLEELERRAFHVGEWASSLKKSSYDWSA